MNLSTGIKQLSDPFDSEDADKAVHGSSPWPYVGTGGGGGGGGRGRQLRPPPIFCQPKKLRV